jgi:hypothetical protein
MSRETRHDYLEDIKSATGDILDRLHQLDDLIEEYVRQAGIDEESEEGYGLLGEVPVASGALQDLWSAVYDELRLEDAPLPTPEELLARNLEKAFRPRR